MLLKEAGLGSNVQNVVVSKLDLVGGSQGSRNAFSVRPERLKNWILGGRDDLPTEWIEAIVGFLMETGAGQERWSRMMMGGAGLRI